MNLSNLSLFSDPDTFHRLQAAKSIDLARDSLAEPEPVFETVMYHLAMATEYCRLLVVEPEKIKRNRSKPA